MKETDDNVLEEVNQEENNPGESQVLNEVDSEIPKERNEPLSEPNQKEEENQNKKELNKTDMCQLIYYDFSLK